ncbi:MAG TPA: toxin [Thermoleophilia bacterium]|nr:toxin [Thermoleophilia bacterium]
MRWNAEKNELLRIERGVSFEAMVVAMGAGGLLDVLPHPNQARYPGQRILVVAADRYVYLIPSVEEEQYIFLKTIIPSRKATGAYLHGGGRRAGS